MKFQLADGAAERLKTQLYFAFAVKLVCTFHQIRARPVELRDVFSIRG